MKPIITANNTPTEIAAVETLLASRQFNMAQLFQLSLIGGGSLYYTSCDVDLLLWDIGGITYGCGGSAGVGPYFDRGDNKLKCRWKVGVEVDTLSFDVIPGTSTINGQLFLSAIRHGVFDGAELTVSNAYWPQQAYQNPVIPLGLIIKFVGRIAEVDAGRSLATFSVNSHLELLNQNMPRNLWQSGCVNTLYDASCALNQAAFATGGTALTGSTSSSINATLAQVTGYFNLGIVTFTSGANNGVSRSVKAYTKGSPGTVTLISPFPNAPLNGDTFSIYPGCDKQQGTCMQKFNNVNNYRGFPFIPENSTAV